MTGSQFDLDRCSQCSFVFVRCPRTDFANLYDAGYYAGTGADRTVDYIAEMQDPDTVRAYEWQGILQAVDSLTALGPTTRWLDYGCGLGGLVRWVGAQRGCSIVGFEEGYAHEYLASAGIPHVERSRIGEERGSYDVVTAIEVLEHAVDPISMLTEIRELLRPGGVLFLTTGNARPFQRRLSRWRYAGVPDVHVSFFEPSNLASAMERAGLEPFDAGYLPGLDSVIRYKVLKGLGVRRQQTWQRAVPWKLASRVVDRRFQVSAMPLARRA
jgi:cyclopropane fatty-acyl-phospholipid synthase-like methyltransferase